MKCVRCGYCCVAYDVILPDGSYKENGRQCKYLTWDGDKACCSIHGQTTECGGYRHRWSETPCGQHGQIERKKTDLCRIGVHLRERGETGRKWINKG